MSRIPINQILSRTEYRGKLYCNRIEDIIGITAGLSNPVSSLDKIGESSRLRTQQTSRRGGQDELGLTEFNFETSFSRLFKALSIGWLTLYGVHSYCKGWDCVNVDEEESDNNAAEGKGNEVVEADGLAPSKVVNNVRRQFSRPTALGWFSLWRPVAHLGPLFHSVLVMKVKY